MERTTEQGQPRQLYPRIVSNPHILHGKPVIAGSRLSVEVLLENLASGATIEQLLDGYPFLTRDDIAAALEYAAHLAATAPCSTSDEERAVS